MTKRTLLALSALIAAQAFAMEIEAPSIFLPRELSYTEKKADEASALILEFKGKMDSFGTGINKATVASDHEQFGEPDETEVRFNKLQFPLMKAVKNLEPLGFKLTIQTGGFTTTDLVPAIIDPTTNKLLGFCVIIRSDNHKHALIGGFHEYGKTYKENGAKEAVEEAVLTIPLSTMRFVGLYDDPKRDSRQHISTIAYTGATYNTPQTTPEAEQVLVLSRAEIAAIPVWHASDHGDIALAAIDTFMANEREIRAALEQEMPRANIAVEETTTAQTKVKKTKSKYISDRPNAWGRGARK